eukprot:TRINITY_DN1711_c0_g1_i1.p1 TRINITY_DN1711_c0_g1~~TRINITY_DN1711_c0_g1_i1.p1  ORF type:complete len:1046 (+),score=344.02 TRINITY_DN1711_c0_g1_i1:69-3140(+)
MAPRASFHVVAPWNGKKWRISLPHADLAGVRVEKIARTLSKQVGIPVADFDLLAPDGSLLRSDQRGAEFGLADGLLLRARLRRDPPIPGGAAPTACGARGAASAAGRLSPPAPVPESVAPAAASAAPPRFDASAHSVGYVDMLRRSETARAAALSQSFARQTEPAARDASPRPEDDEVTEPPAPGQASSPAPPAVHGRVAAPVAPPQPRIRSAVSPRRQPPSAPRVPSGTPQGVLSASQVVLQEQLLAEASRAGAVPSIHDIVKPAAPDGPDLRTPQLPAPQPRMSNAAVALSPVLPGPAVPAASHPSPAHPPSAQLPGPAAQLPSPQMPSPVVQMPSPAAQLPSPQLPGPAAQLPSPAAQLPSPAAQLPSPAGSLHQHAPSSVSSVPSGAAALEARIRALRAENAALRQSEQRAAPRTDMPPHWRAPSPGQHSSADVTFLQMRCAELDAEKQRLQEELRVMKSELSEDKRQRMRRWDEEHDAFRRRQEQIVAEWEAEKQRLLRALTEGGTVDAARRRDDHAGSAQERESALVAVRRENHSQRGMLEARRQQVDAARQRLSGLRTELQQLKGRLSRSRHDAQQNELFVGAAKQQLTELQSALRQHAGASAEVLATAATERALARERVNHQRLRHSQLTSQLQSETALRKHLHNTLEDIKGHVRVLVRVRPLLPHESTAQPEQGSLVEAGALTVLDDTAVSVSTPTTGTKRYSFYRVLDGAATQDDAFTEVSPLIQSTLDGFNVSVLAYGQTGSGKTHTILGDGTEAGRGVVPRALSLLFSLVQSDTVDVELKCSMIEVYIDTPRDLLAAEPRKCEIRSSPSVGAHVVGASEVTVRSADDALAVLARGSAHRQVRPTLANARSSRSHLIFTTALRVRSKLDGSVRTAKLVFVDLAGSERVKRTLSVGQSLDEARNINKSLVALGDVVDALSQRRPHVPYRNSKLTMLLQDTLGGNAKALLIACVCPSGRGVPSSISETVTTLGFASRVRTVQNPYLRNITSLQNSSPFVDRRGDAAGEGLADPV